MRRNVPSEGFVSEGGPGPLMPQELWGGTTGQLFFLPHSAAQCLPPLNMDPPKRNLGGHFGSSKEGGGRLFHNLFLKLDSEQVVLCNCNHFYP